MEGNQERSDRRIVGGVDTHKDLHVAAVVDESDRVLASQCFATTRHGYKQMVAWMRGFGLLQRVGIEATGSYGAGLLRYMQKAAIEVLEVTTPDKHDRRKRGKNDDLDAQNAAHAAFAGKRTVTPKSRDGMIESLRVLKACRKTAVAARRVALQVIQNTIVCAPDELRESLRKLTRMQLIRTLAARVRMSCMRVILRNSSRNSSGAQTIVFWIICRATRRAATAVLRQALSTRRDSIMPLRLLGVTVRLPANAAWAAFCASRSSFFPRLRRSCLSGVVTSRTSMPAFCM